MNILPRRLDAALRRIETGEYGYCKETVTPSDGHTLH
jgi:RNA polymerase-binding transcription factor DksA